MSLTSRLKEYYRSHDIGYDYRKFMAFSIMLKAMEYRYSDTFIEGILNQSPKSSRHRYNGLLRNGVLRKKPNIEPMFLFLMMTDLRIKISKIMMQNVMRMVGDEDGETFERLCRIYFDCLRTGILESVLDLDAAARATYFKERLKSRQYNIGERDKIQKGKETISSLLKRIKNENTDGKSRIGSFKPRYSNSNGIWENKMPLYIQSIPMGGMNKRY